jgi:hypothetical protein
MDRKFSGNGMQSGAPEQTFWLGRALEARQEERAEAPAQPLPREGVRRQLNLEVLVNHGLDYSTPWQVHDLSLTGAFVVMDAPHLPEGSYVEVVLRYRYKGTTYELRLPATVTRLEERGMALTFGRYDDATYTCLTNLLYAL